jgi:hypothetical protein
MLMKVGGINRVVSVAMKLETTVSVNPIVRIMLTVKVDVAVSVRMITSCAVSVATKADVTEIVTSCAKRNQRVSA